MVTKLNITKQNTRHSTLHTLNEINNTQEKNQNINQPRRNSEVKVIKN